MLVTITMSEMMAVSNCMTLASLKQQEDKSALTFYATEIVVPTANKRRYV